MKAGPNANNDWYEIVEGCDLQQGDIVTDCPVFFPVFKAETEGDDLWDFDSATFDLVILTQSCDLEGAKVDNVVLCPLASYAHVRDDGNHPLSSAKMFKRAIENREPAFFVLAGFEDEGLGREPSVVAFRQVYTLPLEFISKAVAERGPRLRLRSPYREALALRFGSFFQRVGLPYDVEV